MLKIELEHKVEDILTFKFLNVSKNNSIFHNCQQYNF